MQVRKRGAHQKPKLFGTLILDFSASRAVLNKCLLFKPLGGILCDNLGRQIQPLFCILSKCSHLLSLVMATFCPLRQPSICLWVSSCIFREEIYPPRHPTEQSQLCPWAPHRTRPLTLPQYRFRYLQAEASTIPTISGFRGDRGHIIYFFFLLALSTLYTACPR